MAPLLAHTTPLFRLWFLIGQDPTPRAAALDDTVLISASVRFSALNGTVTAISDASFVNVLVEAERADLLDPASDCTAVFFLTGMVLSDLPAKREFILETGSWSTEV